MISNGTMIKFGYPGSAVRDYRHWAVMLRPKQATLGALILACKSEATSFSAIGSDAFAELPGIIADIEKTLPAAFGCDKMNYLMLMMTDPHVHFHVLPRYAKSIEFAGTEFPDGAWPGAPDLSYENECGDQVKQRIFQKLKAAWPAS